MTTPHHHRAAPMLVGVGLAAIALAAAACGSNSGSGATTTTSSQPAASGSGGGTTGVVVKAEKSATLGEILVDSKGFTVYTYKPDPLNKATCTGSCASIWPALTVSSMSPDFGSMSGLAVIHGQGGHLQVTYHGHPLYTFTGDSSPGQTNGEGYKGIWHVVKVGSSSSGGGGTTSTSSGGGYGY